MWTTLIILLIFTLPAILFFGQPAFGRLPRGERLQRIRRSPNYRDGQFRNLTPTRMMASGKSRARIMWDFLTRRTEGLRPGRDLPSMKTELAAFGRDREVVVWLGHSSLFIQTGGLRLLIDPVLVKAAPASFFNRPFRGTSLYTSHDMPEIDYLVISHDHWDHLDYHTVTAIRFRKVVCPLGVGEHFERWGFSPERIVELDWGESAALEGGMTLHCLPARHFSGRGPRANQTLWASFLLQTPARNIYLSGDGGYDAHFGQIKARFGRIDLAFMENGQYNEDWKYIHLLPADLLRAVGELRPEALLTVHHSKYALARHPWREPLDNIARAALRDSIRLLTPVIGQPVDPYDPRQVFERWWETAG